MPTRKELDKIWLLIGLLILFNLTTMVSFWMRPVQAAGTVKDPYIVMTGVGSAPGCPSGFTERVGQTSGGTFAPVTSISGASIACDSGGCAGFGGYGGVPSTVPASSSTTTYTYYYRVCSKN